MIIKMMFITWGLQFRKAHPDLPIITLSHPGTNHSHWRLLRKGRRLAETGAMTWADIQLVRYNSSSRSGFHKPYDATLSRTKWEWKVHSST